MANEKALGTTELTQSITMHWPTDSGTTRGRIATASTTLRCSSLSSWPRPAPPIGEVVARRIAALRNEEIMISGAADARRTREAADAAIVDTLAAMRALGVGARP